jgi:hypothetical protein
MSGVINGVRRLKQGDFTTYNFPLSASRIVELGIISRLHDNKGGVQRNLDTDKSANIALAMENPETAWLEPLLVHMEPAGSWEFHEKAGTITYQDGFYLSIDDGQHRRYAMQTLMKPELERLGELSITAAYGLTFEQRLRLFLQQGHRKQIAQAMKLEGRYRLNEWKRPVEKSAYELILKLNNYPKSPLFERVQVVDTGKKTIILQPGEVAKVQATVLHSVLASSLGVRSVLNGANDVEKDDIVMRYIGIAASLWPEKWQNQEEYFLSTSRGVNILLGLLFKSNTMRMYFTHTGNDYRDASLRSCLSLAKVFNWRHDKHKGKNDSLITTEIDHMMSTAYKRRNKS